MSALMRIKQNKTKNKNLLAQAKDGGGARRQPEFQPGPSDHIAE